MGIAPAAVVVERDVRVVVVRQEPCGVVGFASEIDDFVTGVVHIVRDKDDDDNDNDDARRAFQRRVGVIKTRITYVY